jgi:hypothetical protein
MDEVFHVVDEETRAPVENPAAKVLTGGTTVGLANHAVLMARDGHECAVDDSAAPIVDADGQLHGVVPLGCPRTGQARQAAPDV